jgi:hypothetical protein
LIASQRGWRSGAVVAGLALALASSAFAAEDEQEEQPKYPTTEFAEGAKSASVTVGDITAGVSMVRRPDVDPNEDVPVLQVLVGSVRAFETPGVPSGMETPAAEASIAEIDPGNKHQEVYFASYSGGAHCCTHVIVAEEVAGKWVAVTVGDFDGDGRYLDDVDGDGIAEIVTVDNRFLYQFDCYACSSAPLQIYTVHDGKAVDVTSDKRYLGAHRDWLKRMEEDADPDERWTSAGFLAGWVAEKARVGEGADAFKQLTQHWDYGTDVGEEVCATGGEIDSCGKRDRKIMKFPERLKLFLQQSGYQL